MLPAPAAAPGVAGLAQVRAPRQCLPTTEDSLIKPKEATSCLKGRCACKALNPQICQNFNCYQGAGLQVASTLQRLQLPDVVMSLPPVSLHWPY